MRDKLAPIGHLDIVDFANRQVENYGREYRHARTTNDVLRRQAAASFNKGNQLLAQGKLEGALKNYTEGKTIIERLATQDPTNTQWQRDMAHFKATIAALTNQRTRTVSRDRAGQRSISDR